MELIYKRAGIEDIDMLTKTRVEVLRAANNLDQSVDMSLVEAQSYDYYRKSLRDGSHVAYLVYEGEPLQSASQSADGNRFAGAGGVSFYRVMPTFHNPTGYKAYIMNMYTAPQFRRRGIAYHTLDLLVKSTLNKGINHIALEATDMGRPLYAKYGFVAMNDEMKLPEKPLR